MKFPFYLIITVLFFSSCIQKFDFESSDKSQKLIVEGTITDKPGPYFFRLTLSKSNFDDNWQSIDLTDTAIITLSDNNGVTDTLRFLRAKYQIHPQWLYTFLVIPNYDGKFDTIRTLGLENQEIKGIYYTTFIKGQVGSEYTLNITYKNQTYMAKEYMNPVPVIDSISFVHKETAKDNEEFFVPLLYFKKPKNGINYYLFGFSKDELESLLMGASGNWNFSILSDEFLPNYINGYRIDDGASPKNIDDFVSVKNGDLFKLKLFSLSKEAYKYNESLISQFDNDGGVFTPVPSPAPSNISNGALGYFRVSAVSEISVVVK